MGRNFILCCSIGWLDVQDVERSEQCLKCCCAALAAFWVILRGYILMGGAARENCKSNEEIGRTYFLLESEPAIWAISRKAERHMHTHTHTHTCMHTHTQTRTRTHTHAREPRKQLGAVKVRGWLPLAPRDPGYLMTLFALPLICSTTSSPDEPQVIPSVRAHQQARCTGIRYSPRLSITC